MPLPLHTDRLAIRPLAASDAADVFALYGDPHVLRFWNSGQVADLDEAREWAAGQGVVHAHRGYAQWHVSERTGGRFVGCLRRIVAVAYSGNAASRHVLEKLAMAPRGPRSCYGAVLEEYALTLDEWRAGG